MWLKGGKSGGMARILDPHENWYVDHKALKRWGTIQMS